MKLPFKSIRWRLQAWHGLLLLLVLLGFGLRSYFLTRDNRFAAIDRSLLRESVLAVGAMPDSAPREAVREVLRQLFRERFKGRVQRDWHIPSEHLETLLGTNGFPAGHLLKHSLDREFVNLLASSEQAGFYYLLWPPQGALVLRSTNAPASLARPAAATPSSVHARTRGEVREQILTAADGSQLLVGCSIASELAGLHHLALRLGATAGVILLLGLAGGWWLSNRAIRPIHDISAAAAKIASGHLTERFNLSDTDSELGQLAGVLNASFDQVQGAVDQLQTALKRQVQFTADASHELRTPVAVVLAEANSALARERTSAEYKEALESCRNAARRMRQLTDALLTLAGLDAAEHPSRRELCDLRLVAREALQLLRPLAEARAVALLLEVGSGPCLGDAAQLGQVVTNLVGNAIQYNRPGGEVRVRVDSGLRTTVLSVWDTGPGIAAEDLPHIFERFYRADKSRSHANGHLGLGLAITKAIVEAHGGTIQVSSQPGAGSTFTVSLPRPEVGCADYV